MAQELEFRIKPDGSLSIETFGFTGPEACSKAIEQARIGIGGEIVDDEKKPEYWDDGGQNVYTNN